MPANLQSRETGRQNRTQIARRLLVLKEADSYDGLCVRGLLKEKRLASALNHEPPSASKTLCPVLHSRQFAHLWPRTALLAACRAVCLAFMNRTVAWPVLVYRVGSYILSLGKATRAVHSTCSTFSRSKSWKIMLPPAVPASMLVMLTVCTRPLRFITTSFQGSPSPAC